jgi:hypothetical protein
MDESGFVRSLEGASRDMWRLVPEASCLVTTPGEASSSPLFHKLNFRADELSKRPHN